MTSYEFLEWFQPHRTRNPTLGPAGGNGKFGERERREGREVQELRSMMGRLWSPRIQPRQKALPAPPQLALPAPETNAKKQRQRGSRGAKKGTGKSGKNNRASTQVGGSSSSNAGLVDFEQLKKKDQKSTGLFHPSNREHVICFNFQKRQCADPRVCNRRHVCIGCATEGRPYNECHCLQSRLNLASPRDADSLLQASLTAALTRSSHCPSFVKPNCTVRRPLLVAADSSFESDFVTALRVSTAAQSPAAVRPSRHGKVGILQGGVPGTASSYVVQIT